MTEDIGGIGAYTLDSEGNRQDIEVQPPVDDDDDDDEGQAFPPAAGFHHDGSRRWRFVPAADPRQWGDLTYIDQNIAEVKQLGWIEDNPAGSFWTVDEAIQAYEAWAEAATAAYRTVDYGDGDLHVDPYVPVADRAQPPPMEPAAETAAAYEPGRPASADQQGAVAAAPLPPGPQWERPADRALVEGRATAYGDVMDELRARVPENEGRWSATQAAAFDRDEQFFKESGIDAAQRREQQTADAGVGADGTVTPEGYVALSEAGADVSRASLAADSTRNRYQQSTDWIGPADAEDRAREIDESVERARRTAETDAAAAGIGLSAEVQEYMARSGQQLAPGSVLSAEQQAWLEDARRRDQQAAEQADAAFWASPEGQEARARAAAEQQRQDEAEQRLQASRERAEQRMQTPTSERFD